MREIASALGVEAFESFERTYVPVHLSTMTEYDRNFDFPVLFTKDRITSYNVCYTKLLRVSVMVAESV